MEQKDYLKLCEIIECKDKETVSVKEAFYILRALCSKATMDLIDRKEKLSKTEIVCLFANIILHSAVLTLANEYANEEEHKIVDDITNKLDPLNLKVERKDLN